MNSNSVFFKFLFLFVCIGISTAFSQSVNQFDESGKRHGKWEQYYPDSEQLRYEGNFEHGKEIGEFKFYCEDCKKQPEAILKYNKRNAVAQVSYFDKKGRVISQGEMENQKRIGKWIYFHPNSTQIMSEENYSDGELHGRTTTYFSNGNKTEEIDYVHGIQHGIHNYYSENGVLIKKLKYENGKLHGPAFYYDAHGQTTIEGAYKQGKKDGVWKYYENGTVVLEEEYPKKYERKSVPD